MECVKCGLDSSSIRRNGYICGTEDPQTGELVEEYGRHRYKPYSDKELATMAEDERKISEYYKGFAEMFN